MGTVRRAVKRDAKKALHGGWGTAVGITVILIVVGLVLGVLQTAVGLAADIPGYAQTLSESSDPVNTALATAPRYLLYTLGVWLVTMVFLAPLAVGTADWYMCRTDGRAERASHIFWPFGTKKFWGSLVLWIALRVVKLFWTVVFLAVPSAGIGYALYSLYSAHPDPSRQALLITGAIAGGLAFLAMLFLLGVFLTRYSLCSYLMGHKYAKGPFSAMSMSVRCTRGHRFETFWFALSFLPWALLSLLVIPLFYAAPYISMSWAMYTRYLVELRENGRAQAKAMKEAAAQAKAAAAAQPAPAAEAWPEPQPLPQAGETAALPDGAPAGETAPAADTAPRDVPVPETPAETPAQEAPADGAAADGAAPAEAADAADTADAADPAAAGQTADTDARV